MISKLLAYSPVQILSALGLFSLIAVHTRFLLPEDYGFLAVLMVVAEASRAVFIQWLNSCLIRFYPSAETVRKNQLVFITVRWLGFNLVLSFFIISLCVWALTDFQWITLFSVYSYFMLKAIYLYILEFIRVSESASIYRTAVVIQVILSIGFSIGLLTIEPSIELALLAISCSYIVAILLNIRPLLNKVRRQYPLDLEEELFSYGTPLIISGLLSILATRSDRLFIANLAGFEEAGLYAAVANLLFGVMSLVFMVVALPLYPELTKLTGERGKLYQKHKNYSGLLLAVSLPACVGLCLIAPLLVDIFLGSAYRTIDLRAYYLVAIAALLLNFRGHFLDHGLQFMLQTKYIPIVTAVVFIVQVFLSMILVPDVGALGAAVGISSAMLVGAIMTGVVGMIHGYRYPVPQALGNTLAASAGMIAMNLFVKNYIVRLSDFQGLLVLVSISVISYVSIHIVLNSFESRTFLLRKGGFKRAT